MDWKIVLSTFITVFIAELGDKTQIATFSLAAGSLSKWPVIIGAALALIATTLIAVMLGSLIGGFISPIWMKRLAGAIFLVLGVLYISGRA